MSSFKINTPNAHVLGVYLNTRHPGFVSPKFAQHMDGREEQEQKNARCYAADYRFRQRRKTILSQFPRSRILPTLILE